MSEEELRYIRNILTMSDDVRTSLVYDRANFLKEKLVVRCKRCDGTGTKYKLIKGKLKSYPCNCYRRFSDSVELMIAGVDENALNKIISTKAEEIVVVELDITTDRDGKDSMFEQYDQTKLFKNHLDKYMENPQVVIENGYSYLFTGYNSTGKTFSALQALYAFLRKGFTGHYILFRNLMKLINRAITGKGKERTEAESLLREIFSVDLLVIDELGKEGGGRTHTSNELESLLKERDQHNLPCILISNHTCEELIDMYTSEASDFTSVFMNSYRVFLFSAKIDFRKKHRKRWSL